MLHISMFGRIPNGKDVFQGDGFLREWEVFNPEEQVVMMAKEGICITCLDHAEDVNGWWRCESGSYMDKPIEWQVRNKKLFYRWQS